MQNLNEFIQQNFTGPFNIDIVSDTDASILDIDGEQVYHLTKSPRLLFDAISELRKSGSDMDNYWLMRALFVHQRLLENPSNTLYTEIIALSTSINQCSLPLPMQHSFFIELALIQHYYTRDSLVNPLLKSAADKINFQFKLTGALGKRTKHQEFEIVQLVVDATPSSTLTNANESLPQTLDLNDDTLLENISFTDPRFHKRLNPLDQCILLAHCLNVKNVNPAHGLTIEEMASYVARVLENANSWLVHSMALLIRTRLEAGKTRTVERACLQLQALVDQCALVEPAAEERIDNFFCVLMPPIWELEKELGERFVSLGLVVSALEIFKRLQLWDDAISCYQMMEKNKEAEAICLTQLELNPSSPKFLCLLGDLRNDPSLYERAWEASGCRYARAMRSLAARFFKDQNCIECYGKALAINPLFDNSWFVMGCAAMRIENYDVAVVAFIKVVNIDFENGEAWTNLASVYIKRKKKQEAWRALREALKIMYDNQKIWQNFMYCSIDLMEIGETIVAFKRCVELSIARGKDKDVQVDIEVLELLVESVVGDLIDSDGCGSSKHQKSLTGLFVYLFTIISNSVKLFVVASGYYAAIGEKKNGLEYLKKAWRVVLNQPGMNLEEGKFMGCVDVTLRLFEGYMGVAGVSEVNRLGAEEFVCADYLYQAKTTLKTVLSRTSDWEAHASYKLLVDAKTRLETM